MELTTQDKQELINLLLANTRAISKLSKIELNTVPKETVLQALREYQILGNKELDTDFLEQVYIMLDESKISIKEFKNILSKIAYQVKQGNVRSIKGYTLNALAKETKQSIYHK